MVASMVPKDGGLGPRTPTSAPQAVTVDTMPAGDELSTTRGLRAGPRSNIDVLVRCPLLTGLADSELEALAAASHRRSYGAGESLFMDGDDAQGLMVIASGRVKIFVLSPASGREMVLSVEHQYGAVAELVALDGGTYPASAEAVEPTELVVIEQASFQRVIHARPEIALYLMRTLGRRLRRLVGLIEQISFKEVVHRLAAYLLEQTAGDLPYQLETNAVIANRLGTVPELVSRNLGRIHAGGGVVMEGRTIVAIDEARLRELAAAAGR